MRQSSISKIKRAQKESSLMRIISELFAQTAADDSRLSGLFITRVSLSSDKSVCAVFFYTHGGLEDFQEKLEVLKLYKPSLRKSIANHIPSRYTPELVFKFDTTFERSTRMEQLLDSLKTEEEQS